jgi:hypothetical protein
MYLTAGCHRCTCPIKDFLDTTKTWPAKTTQLLKESVLTQAAQCTARGAVPGPVVQIAEDGMSCTPGPNAAHYEASRSAAGAHLLFNGFWLVTNFCIFQMYMRDSLHQIDHGILIHVLRGILRLFFGK